MPTKRERRAAKQAEKRRQRHEAAKAQIQPPKPKQHRWCSYRPPPGDQPYSGCSARYLKTGAQDEARSRSGGAPRPGGTVRSPAVADLERFDRWMAACERFRECPETGFPQPPLPRSGRCRDPFCAVRRVELAGGPGAGGACVHTVRELLRGSGQLSGAWLRRFRVQWHPDRFATEGKKEFRAEAEEVFKILSALLDEM